MRDHANNGISIMTTTGKIKKRRSWSRPMHRWTDIFAEPWSCQYAHETSKREFVLGNMAWNGKSDPGFYTGYCVRDRRGRSSFLLFRSKWRFGNLFFFLSKTLGAPSLSLLNFRVLHFSSDPATTNRSSSFLEYYSVLRVCVFWKLINIRAVVCFYLFFYGYRNNRFVMFYCKKKPLPRCRLSLE